MAVLEELPGVELNIVVDGVELKEYVDEDENNEPRTKIVYIEAVSNKTFEIRYHIKKNAEFKGGCLSSYLKVDGRDLSGRAISKEKVATEDHTCSHRGIEIPSEKKIKLFRFCGLETVSDGHCLKDEAFRYKDLGSIIVEFHHENKIGQTSSSEQESQSLRIVSEKAIKGKSISHSVNFETIENVQSIACFWRTSPVDPSRTPAGTFIFRYRSMAALKSMLIIPRTPTPPPLHERDPATWSAEDLLEIQKGLRALPNAEESAKKIKRERGDDNPRARKIARPNGDSTQLVIDDDGEVRDSTTPAAVPSTEKEVIELD